MGASMIRPADEDGGAVKIEQTRKRPRSKRKGEETEEELDKDEALQREAMKEIFTTWAFLKRGTLTGNDGVFLADTPSWTSIVKFKEFPLGQTDKFLRRDQPDWAPFSLSTDFWIKLEYIEAKSGHGGVGLGRLLVNVIQQYITTSDALNTFGFAITGCHFPIFYTIDSHDHWIVMSDPGNPIPPETPAALIFPMYLKTDTARKREINDRAVYSYVDLQWHSPIDWAETRLSDIEETMITNEKIVSMTRQLRHSILKEMQTWLVQYMEDCNESRTFHYRLPFTTAAPVEAVQFRTDILSEILRGERSAPIIARTCRLLGNMDTFSFKGADSVDWGEEDIEACIAFFELLLKPDMTNVRAFYFHINSFVFSDTRYARLFIQLTLAYLIDYCRVVYRPIIISSALMDKLGIANPEYPFGETELDMHWLPRPSPYFTYLHKTENWVWVPQKKPHSTEWGGTTNIPLPLLEQPPVLEQEEERPKKKPRLIESCFHCFNERATHSDGFFTFCNPTCRYHYYTF